MATLSEQQVLQMQKLSQGMGGIGGANTENDQKIIYNALRRQAETDPNFAQKLDTLSQMRVSIRVAQDTYEATPGRPRVLAGAGAYQVTISPKDYEAGIAVLDVTAKQVTYANQANIEAIKNNATVRGESLSDSDRSQIVINQRRIEQLSRAYPDVTVPQPVRPASTPAAATRTAEPVQVAVQPQARIITPEDTNRPSPIAPVYRQVSPNPMPSFEERVAIMGARIKDLEAQGMPEGRARNEVHKARQAELEAGGMDRNTARSVVNAEKKEELRIDNAQERGMQAQRNMGASLGGFAAQMLGLKGNEAAALRRGTQMVGGMIGNDGVQAPAAQDVRGLAGVGLKEVGLRGVEAKAAQVAVNVGAGVVSGTGPATPSTQDVRGLANAGIREAGIRGPEAKVAQVVVGEVAANADSYRRAQVTEYPQRSERTGYVASPRIDRTFDIQESRQVGPIMAAAANDGTTEKARAEIKQDQANRAELAIPAPKPEPEQPTNGRFDNDTYARARQFANTGPG